jgi:hypothetical protein
MEKSVENWIPAFHSSCVGKPWKACRRKDKKLEEIHSKKMPDGNWQNKNKLSPFDRIFLQVPLLIHPYF